MRRRSSAWLVGGLTVLLSAAGALGQGTFQNLDFEQARIIPIVGNPLYPEAVATTNALPGWTAYIGGSPVDVVLHDDVSLGAALVSIHDSNSVVTVIQGRYTVQLQPSYPGGATSAAVGQVGTVPNTAQSIRFYGNGPISASFAGQQIPLSVLGSGSSYTVYGGDISAFAGQTGELRFQGIVAPFGFGSSLDNIFFSDLPVPEPSTFGLFALGALLLGWRVLGRRR